MKARIVGMNYAMSDSFTVQGKKQSVCRQYAKDGYNVRELGNGGGNWLVYRKASIEVELAGFNEDGKMVHGSTYLRDAVIDMYDKDKMSKGLYNTFRKDAEQGKIDVEAEIEKGKVTEYKIEFKETNPAGAIIIERKDDGGTE